MCTHLASVYIYIYTYIIYMLSVCGNMYVRESERGLVPRVVGEGCMSWGGTSPRPSPPLATTT
jgi:hypothetical protein